MRQDEINFEDADLKESLRRAFPHLSAPRSLHQRIAQACVGGEPPVEAIPQVQGCRIGQWLHSGRRRAIAASIAGLGLGIGLFLAQSRLNVPVATPYASDSPVFVENAMVRHDELQQGASDPRVRQSLFSYPQMRDRLPSSGALYIPNPDLSDHGWEFIGAKPYQSATCFGAQLFYVRNSQSLSVFVLPPGTYTAEIRAACGQKQRHLIANASGRSTFFVVARCPEGKLSQSDIQQIADMLAGR